MNMLPAKFTVKTKLLFVLVLFSLFITSRVTAQSTDQIGSVEFVRGAITGQTSCDGLRILGKQSAVYLTDVISVSSTSFGVVTLNDGTRMSLRPGTVLELKEYSEEAGQEKVAIHLFKGGIRIISGTISKVNPDAFKVTTAASTIGISGTELDARLCETDCVGEAQEITASDQEVPASEVVGRVALAQGELTGLNSEGESRKMIRGAPLFSDEEYETGADSYALLLFRDGGRISLKEETIFRVEDYAFNNQEQGQDRSSVRFVKGGLRALTGAIADDNPDSFRVDTAVATIGIRGTGFDLVWLGPCEDDPECGLIASVWQGAIFSDNDAGTSDINLNQTARIPGINLPPQFIAAAPVFIIPRPDTEQLDLEEFFGQEDQDVAPGLFVACYEGHCSLNQDDQVVDLGPGEAGYAGYQEQDMVRLTGIETFQVGDRYLGVIDQTYDTLFELQDNVGYERTAFECVIR